jgi:hypothetical protein
VVALAVSSLVLGGDLGQTEGAPVGEPANDTAGPDDLGASITGDSVEMELVMRPVEELIKLDIVSQNVLSNLVEAARADLL